MKEVKFKQDCFYKSKFYEAGDVLEDISDAEAVWTLNEKGFIYPLTIKEFQSLYKPGNKPNKKEEE